MTTPTEEEQVEELLKCHCPDCIAHEGGPCRYKIVNKASRLVGVCFSCRKGVHSGTLAPRE